MSYQQIEKLNELRASGAITEEEFQREKQKIFASTNQNQYSKSTGVQITASDQQYTMLMHLSQFASVVIPLAGLVVPIVMWQSKKQNPIIDQHGKVILNWVISSIIYAIISFILIFVIVGIFLLIALVITNLVFVIMGAVKANNGQIWNYPMSIKFFAVDTTVKINSKSGMDDILDS
jgi:uncharacterized protein